MGVRALMPQFPSTVIRVKKQRLVSDPIVFAPCSSRPPSTAAQPQSIPKIRPSAATSFADNPEYLPMSARDSSCSRYYLEGNNLAQSTCHLQEHGLD